MATYIEKHSARNNQIEEIVEPLLTVHEVAKQLRVDDTTIRRWIHAGVLEAIELPHANKRRGYRIRKATMDRMLNR